MCYYNKLPDFSLKLINLRLADLLALGPFAGKYLGHASDGLAFTLRNHIGVKVESGRQFLKGWLALQCLQRYLALEISRKPAAFVLTSLCGPYIVVVPTTLTRLSDFWGSPLANEIPYN